MTDSSLKLNARVKRKDGRGGFGIIKDIRAETVSARTDICAESELMVGVQWDNGTLSYLAPAAIESAEKK